ncbi:MAG: LysR substrate-binding domain-containing protein, partial [Myxococcota bacterium]
RRHGARGRRARAGRLDLGVIPTIAPYLLPRVLPAVRRSYPELQLVLREDQTARLLEQLAVGRLDLLLLALPVEAAFVTEMTLFDEAFVLAAPPDHPLARSELISEGELEDHSVLLLDEGHCLRDQALSVCQAAGAAESEVVRATSLTTLTHLVANGLGVTLLPEMALPAEISTGQNISLRRFTEPQPSRKIGLLWRNSSPREKEFRLLGELVTETVGQRCTTTTPATGT